MADYIQWRNKNSYRAFPVADDAAWVTADGVELDSDIFLDAAITPIGDVGAVWISSINFTENKVTLSSAFGELASAAIAQGEVLNFYDSFNRHIGVIIPNDSFFNIAGDLSFDSFSLPLAPTAVISQRQDCVRGIVLPDGTVMTGDVTLAGIDGMTITTTASGQLVRFDALSDGTEEAACVELPAPVKCVEVRQVGEGGVFAVAVSGNTLNIDAPYDLADLCGNKKDKAMPNEDGDLPNRVDPCDEEEASECNPPSPVSSSSICDTGMYVNILSSLFGTKILAEPGIPAFRDAAGLEVLPEREQQGLQLFVRGVLP